ncbi:MAG: zinc ribbon domain-containing protein [Candidatus Helarchaeota archaeon]
MKCPSCGRKVEKTWNFCRYCRYDLRQKSVISKKQEIQTGQKKCPRCNTPKEMSQMQYTKCNEK